MGQIHGHSHNDGRGEQKTLLRIQKQNNVINDLYACGFLYQTRDGIDEDEVDDQSGPEVIPIELHITLCSGFYCVLLAKVATGCLEPTLPPLHGLGLTPTRRDRERPDWLLLDVCRLV
jgi:hypothetical protein